MMVMMMMSKESEKDINQRRRRRKKKSSISQDEQQQQTRPHLQTHPQRRKDLIKTKQKQQRPERYICLEESSATQTQMVKIGCQKTKQKHKWKSVKRDIIQMMGVFCLGCSTETHTERHRPDRQRGKEMRKMQWKSKESKRKQREERNKVGAWASGATSICKREETYLLSKSLPKPKTSKPNNNNNNKKKKKKPTRGQRKGR